MFLIAARFSVIRGKTLAAVSADYSSSDRVTERFASQAPRKPSIMELIMARAGYIRGGYIR